MEGLGIQESDIVERFIRSSGHGGQNVNKVSTCVYLKHLPTGIEVKCQQERYQAANRFFARRLLVQKIEQHDARKQSEEQQKLRKSKTAEKAAVQTGEGKGAGDEAPPARKKRERAKPDLSEY